MYQASMRRGLTVAAVAALAVLSACATLAPEPTPAPPPPPPPPPAPGGGAPSEAQIEAARLALQPPLQVMTDSACVIYGLN